MGGFVSLFFLLFPFSFSAMFCWRVWLTDIRRSLLHLHAGPISSVRGHESGHHGCDACWSVFGAGADDVWEGGGDGSWVGSWESQRRGDAKEQVKKCD